MWPVFEKASNEREEGGMPNNTAQSCRLFGYSPENESNFSFCHYKYFIANGTDFLQLWLSKGPLCGYLRKEKRRKTTRKKGGGMKG